MVNIQNLKGFNHPFGGAGFRNHPQYFIGKIHGFQLRFSINQSIDGFVFFTHPPFIFKNSIFLFGPCHMIYATAHNDPTFLHHFHLSLRSTLALSNPTAVDCHAFMMICWLCVWWRVGWRGGGGVMKFLALATMFYATLRDLLLHLHPRFMLRYETFHATLWDLLLHLHLEQEIQRIDVWPSTCSTLSKVSCSDTTVGANSGVSLASWRKKTVEIFFYRWPPKYMGKHCQILKKGLPSCACQANFK